MAINLRDHLSDLKGKAYLPVAPRIAYFREAHPGHAIVTDVTIVDGEPRMVRASIVDDGGRILATAHKTVTPFAGGAVEKAETGAIGRALSLCGIGTLLALDFDEIADAPIDPPAKAKPAPRVTVRDVAPTADERADIARMGLDDLRVAYAAARGAGRERLAGEIKAAADALLDKAAAAA